MKTVLKTAAAFIPVSIVDAKTHMRVTDTVDNDYIEGLINAATGHVEQITGRKLINQTWYLYLDQFPGDFALTLPFGNTFSVTSIKYSDQGGVEHTFSSGNYTVDIAAVPGRLVLDFDASWPSDTLFTVNPIVVEFVAGYGAAAADVPDGIRHAIKFLVSHWYENREIVGGQGFNIFAIPDAFNALIDQYRMFGWSE